MKKIISMFLMFMMVFTSVSTYAATMYSLDGRTVKVHDEDVKAWQKVGWYTEPVMKVYEPGGKEAVIYKSQYSEWNAVGWYDYPVVKMYSPYGKTAVVAKSERKTWEAVGWYSFPVVTVYAPDGRTNIIAESDYKAWKAVGWSRNPNVPAKDILYVGGKPYYLGMPRSELGTPDEKLLSTYGLKWYVYGSDDYENFFAALIENGSVVALVSCGKGFSYLGYKAGSKPGSDIRPSFEYRLLTDSNDNGIIHTVSIRKPGYYPTELYTNEALEGESKLNFHLVNAFRVYHGRRILKWSSKAAKSAYLHSLDMATQNYFSHTGLDGSSPWDRLEKQGVQHGSGENIAAGYDDAIAVHNGWINSSGHRNNMLGYHYYLGVGMACSNRGYGRYFTQNFHN